MTVVAEHSSPAYADLELDVAAHQVRVGGVPVGLSLKEFRLLAILMAGAGTVQSRRSLLDRIWAPGYPDTNKTLDVHIARLRRKLGVSGLAVPIRTVRSIGYVFDRPPRRAGR
jgi:DNA-binding response OmpR family regulator